MFLSRFFKALPATALLIAAGVASPAGAATKIQAIYRFTDTGGSNSQYAHGAGPAAELLQATDGNFYGTTTTGGAGLCPNTGTGGVLGCGTVFRLTPQGAITTLYSFPYDTAANTAPTGAFPTAGLIEGQDGYLYGVAQDGGSGRCNGALGCGTMFRISTTGAFKLLHQFCGGDGCANTTEGGRPMSHLVQKPNGTLCGVTAQGGFENEGTVFCATTGGAVKTLYAFEFENGTDGYDPIGALLVGPDGKTLYGTTASRGANGGGILFALKNNTLKILYAFGGQGADVCYKPQAALIFGADGQLYGTTTSGGLGGGCIFSLKTDGSGYAARYHFPATSNAPADPVAGLVLARDGMMYGTTAFGSIEQTEGLDSGVAFRFDPAKGAFKALADFNDAVGASPSASLIEGNDNSLYGTATLSGGGNAHGTDAGTVVRVDPALGK